MSIQTPPSRPDELVFHSLESSEGAPGWRRWAIAGIASLLFHGVLIVGLETAPLDWSSHPLMPVNLTQITERQAVHLVAPKFTLTQPEPNKSKPTTEVSLPQLLSRPEPARTKTPPPTAAKFTPPSAPARGNTTPQQQALPALPGPPKIESGPVTAAGISTQGLPAAPPQTPPEEKPKLAFENLSSVRTSNPEPNRNLPRITMPRSGIEEAMRNAGREPAGGVTVGDSGEPGGMENPMRPQRPGRQASNIELLSDPQGIDFKPYLIRVLAAVRRNWFAVLPESAKMGLRSGKVQVQFAINRDGSVPKLVLASPSGTDAFDRAAVAGISASNPFPPLPPEFKGDQIRLQLSFLYNAH